MSKQSRLDLFLGSGLIFILCQALTFFAVFQVTVFLETNQIAVPKVSTGFALIYFLSAAVLLGLILYFIPIAVLRLVLKILFAFLYSWGVFVFLGLSLPAVAAVLIAVTLGLIWFFRPRIWLHDLLMIFSLASLGATMGPLFSPWEVVVLLAALSVYDVIAVRFGYMVWLVKRLSLSETLPAFLIPKEMKGWNLTFKEANIKNLLEAEFGQREFSVLGGGDLGLPLVLITSVFFSYGFVSSLIVGVFSLTGLFLAYFIQIYILKGKPLPALPPISFVSFIGFLVALLIQA